MLYYKLRGTPEGRWQLGEDIPLPLTDDPCTLIQADGDELIFIRSRFSNIPTSNAKVVCWYGELANFIFHNLRW